MTAWTFYKDNWHEGNPMIMGPMTHAPWLGSCVFDGARAFGGATPDLDQHCQRIVASAKAFALLPEKSPGEIEEIIREGIAKFENGAELYMRPMFWATDGFVDVDPESTEFCISVYDSPLPPDAGFSVIKSEFRRPALEFFPTDAKAACHYPNSARVLREAKARGFENGLMLDPLGNVAELATANIFYAKDGAVHTPAPNGTFLNGVTRQRTIKLLRQSGYDVHERTLKFEDFLSADEIFSTGNFAKLLPITRLEDQDFQPGPIYKKAREIYWDYAFGG